MRNKRAMTDEKKRQILDLLYEEWKRNPKQRLGQLIMNSVNTESRLRLIEDVDLVLDVRRLNPVQSLCDNVQTQTFEIFGD